MKTSEPELPFPDNKSFSTRLRSLQLYIDSHSLGEFKTCPRRYYYSILLGYQPPAESVHLTFGIMLHVAIEQYWKRRLTLLEDHETALPEIVKLIMNLTWDKKLNRPWQSDHKTKNRFTLIRTIVWYLDRFQDDPIRVLTVGSKPAVELPFEIYSGYESQITGEHFILCGRIDRLGELNGNRYVIDVKSTASTISPHWYSSFTPDNQFTIYCIASKEYYDTETAGLIVDGCQIAQSFSAFHRELVNRSESQLEEWRDDLGFHLNNLDQCARSGKWPMNDKACNLYGGCPFRPVCSQPSQYGRDQMLTQYRRRTWDPLQRRGDY